MFLTKKGTNTMKKILAFLLAAVMVLSFAACGSTEEAPEGGSTAVTVEGTALEIIEKIYAEKAVELGLMTMAFADLDPEMIPSFTGLADDSKLADGAVSEPMMGSQAYSLVVVKVNEGESAEAVAQEMAAGIDPAKWVCVQADDVVVAAYGDTVMLFMIYSELGAEMGVDSAAMVSAFNTVVGGEAKTFTK